MRITDTSDLWWKNAVLYCLDVETFLDSDADGQGDFQGLSQRVDYLADLGVTCLWLMPFYPSPGVDDGYDISDFYAVDPDLGTFGDFVEFIRMARDRGMRVIIDLVVNHTSDQHPWFQSARASRDSPYRDWYVWADEPPADGPQGVTFPDKEVSLWQYDEVAGQYYLHRFYRSQPDLNVANPKVRDEIAKIILFWAALGVSGFRVDAVPFLIETLPSDKSQIPDPHEFLRHLRSLLNRRTGEAILLGEVNLTHEDQRKFFASPEGGGQELTMQFDFIGMQALYLAMARQDASPLIRAIADRPPISVENQWATFVRNHDELTLDKLTLGEREEVFRAFGPKPEMQLYGRGLRRRIPTMLKGDMQRIRMVYSLLLSLPGTPVLFYGEEIGMGENLAEDGRLAVRTPMQWTPEPGGGFTTADPAAIVRPFPKGAWSPKRVNVADQRDDPDSLYSFVRQLIRFYRECPELGWGTFSALESPDAAVFAHRSDWEDRSVIAVHNLSPRAVTVTLTLDGVTKRTKLHDVLRPGITPVDAKGAFTIELDGYGYRWLRHQPDGTLPI
jgi:trehalose synthase